MCAGWADFGCVVGHRGQAGAAGGRPQAGQGMRGRRRCEERRSLPSGARAACWHVCVKCVMCENEYIYVCAFANMCTDRLLDSIAAASPLGLLSDSPGPALRAPQLSSSAIRERHTPHSQVRAPLQPRIRTCCALHLAPVLSGMCTSVCACSDTQRRCGPAQLPSTRQPSSSLSRQSRNCCRQTS